MSNVTVIIVSYNIKGLLKRCLQSLFVYAEGVSFSVVVVDNNSKDGSVQMVKKLYPQVKLIENKENLGFARANNIAMRDLKSPYVMFLNPDTYITKDVIFEMYRYLKGQPSVALVGPMLYRIDGRIQPSAYKRYPNLLITLLEYCMPLQYFLIAIGRHPHNLVVKNNSLNAVDVAHLLGACFMVKKIALDAVGMFDERFFIYREETDLCFRLRKKGYTLKILPWVSIYHYGAKSTKTLGISHTAASPHYLKSLYLYHQKYYPGTLNKYLLALGILTCSLITFFSALFALPFTLFSNKLKEKTLIYLKIPIKIIKWHFKPRRLK